MFSGVAEPAPSVATLPVNSVMVEDGSAGLDPDRYLAPPLLAAYDAWQGTMVYGPPFGPRPAPSSAIMAQSTFTGKWRFESLRSLAVDANLLPSPGATPVPTMAILYSGGLGSAVVAWTQYHGRALIAILAFEPRAEAAAVLQSRFGATVHRSADAFFAALKPSVLHFRNSYGPCAFFVWGQSADMDFGCQIRSRLLSDSCLLWGWAAAIRRVSELVGDSAVSFLHCMDMTGPRNEDDVEVISSLLPSASVSKVDAGVGSSPMTYKHPMVVITSWPMVDAAGDIISGITSAEEYLRGWHRLDDIFPLHYMIKPAIQAADGSLDFPCLAYSLARLLVKDGCEDEAWALVQSLGIVPEDWNRAGDRAEVVAAILKEAVCSNPGSPLRAIGTLEVAAALGWPATWLATCEGAPSAMYNKVCTQPEPPLVAALLHHAGNDGLLRSRPPFSLDVAQFFVEAQKYAHKMGIVHALRLPSVSIRTAFASLGKVMVWTPSTWCPSCGGSFKVCVRWPDAYWPHTCCSQSWAVHVKWLAAASTLSAVVISVSASSPPSPLLGPLPPPLPPAVP